MVISEQSCGRVNQMTVQNDILPKRVTLASSASGARSCLLACPMGSSIAGCGGCGKRSGLVSPFAYGLTRWFLGCHMCSCGRLHSSW